MIIVWSIWFLLVLGTGLGYYFPIDGLLHGFYLDFVSSVRNMYRLLRVTNERTRNVYGSATDGNFCMEWILVSSFQ